MPLPTFRTFQKFGEIMPIGFGQKPATRHCKAVDSTADSFISIPVHATFGFEKR